MIETLIAAAAPAAPAPAAAPADTWQIAAWVWFVIAVIALALLFGAWKYWQAHSNKHH